MMMRMKLRMMMRGMVRMILMMILRIMILRIRMMNNEDNFFRIMIMRMILRMSTFCKSFHQGTQPVSHKY